MLRLDTKIAHNDVFHGSNKHAARCLVDRFKDAGLAFGNVEAGFSADAVTLLRDGGEQCDDAWHIGWASTTYEDARKHGRKYDHAGRSISSGGL